MLTVYWEIQAFFFSVFSQPPKQMTPKHLISSASVSIYL